MAEPWNRVNIAFPSAVSSVRVPFSSTTDATVKALMVISHNVLKLIRSHILQTEIRVLYELLYILKNSLRGNKTYKGLKLVEQCINRLKLMKLDVAVQDLTELCPNKIQRVLSIRSGKGDVPSQPFLEWLCLKVLGGAQLLSCTLDRCSTAFVFSKQQMKWGEFVILNLVITSMLSRLWVIFRGILASLSTLYPHLLDLHREVASAKPMAFLTDSSLPTDITQFLGYTDAFILSKLSAHISCCKEKDKKQRDKVPFKVKNQGGTGKVKEDLGVAIERGRVLDTDLKPFLRAVRNWTKGKDLLQETHGNKKEAFKKQVQQAATVTDMMTHLKEMIDWFKSQKKKKEKSLLASVFLKCQRLKGLEAAGYKVQRKLASLRQEVLCTLSPQASASRTCQSAAMMWKKAHQKNCLQSLTSRLRSSSLRAGIKKKLRKRQWNRTDFTASTSTGNEQRHRTGHTTASQANDSDSHDEIDDIFASVDL
ncbi:nucleolus and neural progenitor protein [Antennarius striatus]|uniref:nucleolus and neural progenitor protein n=1 Tax=Antennarius striatus TaxID=241820 RepID=UPI0035AE0866